MKNSIEYYLHQVGVNSLDNLSFDSLEKEQKQKKLEKLFKLFIKNFLDHETNFDEFSSLCEEMLILIQHDDDLRQLDIFYPVHIGAELSWYIRNDVEKIPSMMDQIFKYNASK